MRRWLLAIVVLGSASAQDMSTLTIPRVLTAPKIEDYLEGKQRSGEIRISGFRQREPGDGTPVSQETTAYLSYDARNIYAIFVCHDEAGRVRAHMSKREDLGDDDRVTLYLDTFRDNRNAFVFTSNPLGIQSDAIQTEGRGADGRFDTLWESAGKITPDGYVVWMAIPFKSLRFSSEDVQTWGIALSRSITRTNEKAFWPFVTRRQNSFLRQLARLQGLEDISPGRNIQLTPYGSFLAARSLDGSGRFVNDRDKRGGIDAKVILHDSLTLDMTVNPDFSQVESDDPQVTVNQRYEVRFPEKRPFFLENASYFDTPITLFFSRRIADPEYGARLTGKVGRWSMGFLGADDRSPGILAPPTSPMYGRRAVYGVGRIQRLIGKESSFGAMATTYDFGTALNRVFSLDTRLKLSPTWVFNGQAVRSQDQSPNGVGRKGSAYSADLTHGGRNLTYSAGYLDFSPDFKSQPGFIKRVNMRQGTQYLGYYWYPESSRLISAGPSVSAGAVWDRQGILTDWFGNADFGMDFAGPIGFKAGRYQAFERYLATGFHYAKDSVSFYSGNLKWLYLYGSYSQGKGINYVPADYIHPYLGKTTDASFGFTLRPRSRMRIEQFYYYSRLATNDSSVFLNHLFRTKVNYQFTRALSVRLITDYYGLLTDPTRIAQDKSKQLTGDILFTYLPHPGTAIYFGYTNRRQNVAIEPGPPSYLRYNADPLRFTGHQLFVKVSYHIRL